MFGLLLFNSNFAEMIAIAKWDFFYSVSVLIDIFNLHQKTHRCLDYSMLETSISTFNIEVTELRYFNDLDMMYRFQHNDTSGTKSSWPKSPGG